MPQSLLRRAPGGVSCESIRVVAPVACLPFFATIPCLISNLSTGCDKKSHAAGWFAHSFGTVAGLMDLLGRVRLTSLTMFPWQLVGTGLVQSTSEGACTAPFAMADELWRDAFQ
jgi:hypothetical protein